MTPREDAPLRMPPSAGSDPARVLRVAAGQGPADLVVRGGTLANVYTGELLSGWGVAVVGDRIASIGPETETWIGPDTAILEAAGQVVAPGFIDAHTHLDYFHRLDRFLEAAIPTGLTTVVSETAMASNVGGFPAVASFLESCAAMPITVLATAPTISYLLSDRGDGQPMISTEEMARLLEEPQIVGLGEAYWPEVLAGQAGLPELISRAAALGKPVEGHSAGARGGRLAAYVAAGISSCHEPITAEEVQARLRLGLYTMVRDGSIRRDISALRGAFTTVSPRRLLLASDTVWAHHLLARGYLDETARQAVAMGLSPMQVLQAITLTPAEHFRIDDRLGGLAPGRQADLVLLEDLAGFRPSLVLSRGRVVARDGRTTVPIPPPQFSPAAFPPPRLAAPLTLEDLKIPAPGGADRVSLRVIEYAGEILTRERIVTCAPKDGCLESEPGADRVKVIAFDRRGRGQVARGFVSGYGFRRGALALSLSFDCANLLALGVWDSDMLLAMDRMLAQGGGAVVAADGVIRSEIPLPIAGITSPAPLQEMSAQIRDLERSLRELGCRRADPFLSAQVLTFTAIPALRIRERGLWEVRRKAIVPLFCGDGSEGGVPDAESR